MSSNGLKYGSWVYYGGRLGLFIHMRYNEMFAREEIHFVDKDRLTVEIVGFDPSVECVYAGIKDEETLIQHLERIDDNRSP